MYKRQDIYIDRHTNRDTGRQTDRQTDRRLDRQTDRQRDRQRNRRADRQTYIQTDRHADRQKDRQTDRQIKVMGPCTHPGMKRRFCLYAKNQHYYRRFFFLSLEVVPLVFMKQNVAVAIEHELPCNVSGIRTTTILSNGNALHTEITLLL